MQLHHLSVFWEVNPERRGSVPWRSLKNGARVRLPREGKLEVQIFYTSS